ncbi:Mismatch repair protein msh3 [Coemansia sp. Benny D115]|nr:Mismatch repair protein msh3 [Coemansia sp. Benny D115]
MGVAPRPKQRVQASLSSFFVKKNAGKVCDPATGKENPAEPSREASPASREISPATKRQRTEPTSTAADQTAQDTSKAATATATASITGRGTRKSRKKSTPADAPDILQERVSKDEPGAGAGAGASDDDDDGSNGTSSLLAQMSMHDGPPTLDGTHTQLVQRKPGARYTPLEQQVLEIKKQHPDTLLAVEVGYKYRFFGEDARIASRVLGIMCTTANNFYNASIPSPRLLVHTRRLVYAGFRVGVVRQKQVGSTFERYLAEVLTAGTMVEQDEDGAPWIASVWWSADSIGLVAAQVSTGTVLVDFLQGALDEELATRLEHLQPAEILLPNSHAVPQVLRRTLASWAGTLVDPHAPPEPRLEHAEHATSLAGRSPRISFAQQPTEDLTALCTQHGVAKALPRLLELPEPTQQALAQLLGYLAPMGMSACLLANEPAVEPFHTGAHLLLSAPTLRTLGVFDDPSDQKAPGDTLPRSLFALMDHTRTPFGRRMLRRWVAHPLVDPLRLSQRQEAVSWLYRGIVARESAEEATELAALHGRGGLGMLADIERGLCRIHYAQAQPAELLRVLTSLRRATLLMPRVARDASLPKLLSQALDQCAGRTDLQELVDQWLSEIDAQSARSGTLDTLFSLGPRYEQLQKHHRELDQVDIDIRTEEASVGQVLGLDNFSFRSISGLDCLIDIRSTQASKVPATWSLINSTKTHKRYRTPRTIELLANRDSKRLDLRCAAEQAYRGFIHTIATHHAELQSMVRALASIDALLALAQLAATPGYTQPVMTAGDQAEVRLEGALHPVLLARVPNYVPNDFVLDGHHRAALLTGPNAGGKSSLARTVALHCLMAQTGSYVPAKSAHLGILDAIYTRLGAGDDLAAGHSTFMVEMRETARILHKATPRSLAILDEVGRGTSTHDGVAIAYAVLQHLVKRKALCVFVTHYAHLVAAFANEPAVLPCHMSFLSQSDSSIAFLYRLVEGASADSFGLNVARAASLPECVLECAMRRASLMRIDAEAREAQRNADALRSAVQQLK